MNILIFADFHEENFTYNDFLKIKIDPDLMLFLGDIPTETLFSLVTTFPNKTYFGILGNHDNFDEIENVNILLKENLSKEKIININGKLVFFNNISFTGVEGCVKKGRNHPGYELTDKIIIPKADILISHEGGYFDLDNITSDNHYGYPQINEYRKKYNIEYHFEGHHHVQFEKIIDNTKCFCVYKCSSLNFNTGEYKRIF